MNATTMQKKVCMLGDYAVGKTSTVRRFVKGVFDDRYLSTIGVKISRRTVVLNEAAVNLIVWDLAGGENHARTQTNYLRGAAGALLVCDLTRPETLAAAEQYAAQLRALTPNAAFILVGNKADLRDERRITDTELAAAGERIGCATLIASAKTGEHVATAFDQLAQLLVAIKTG